MASRVSGTLARASCSAQMYGVAGARRVKDAVVIKTSTEHGCEAPMAREDEHAGLDALYHGEFLARAGPRFGILRGSREHEPFLRALFEATWLEAERRARGSAVPLPPMLMDLQYRSRQATYAGAHPCARDYVATAAADQRPIGRFLVDWRPGSKQPVLGIDVAVHPAARAGAAGLHLLRAWLAVCDRLGRSAELHVLPHNPARHLYRRMGFVDVDLMQCPVAMQRTPRLTGVSGTTPSSLSPG